MIEQRKEFLCHEDGTGKDFEAFKNKFRIEFKEHVLN